jgi:hypothetical protein
VHNYMFYIILSNNIGDRRRCLPREVVQCESWNRACRRYA